MAREFDRLPGGEHVIQILSINDEKRSELADKILSVLNIGKGGFKFETDFELELEDRLQVRLRFPDGYEQEVLGRICYSHEGEDANAAYGFSIISGFYSMDHVA